MKEALNLLSSIKKPLDEKIRAEKAVSLANLVMKKALSIKTKKEKNFLRRVNKTLSNVNKKALIINLVDMTFRSKSNKKTASRIFNLLLRYGFPQELYFHQKISFYLFQFLGKNLKRVIAPIIIKIVKKLLSYAATFDEKNNLENFLMEQKEKKLKVNISSLKNDALGERDIEEQINNYINHLKNPLINGILIKISKLSSKTSYENALQQTLENLRKILKEAKNSSKSITLQMENYKYFYLTVDLFKKLLLDEEFYNLSLGITLQSYLPESLKVQKELIELAKKRKGLPIKIHIVKGAFLSFEQVFSSKRGWCQAPFLTKMETDANFKKMILLGFSLENAKFANTVICTHNIFDIAYALIVREENSSQQYTEFHMFEGRENYIKNTLHALLKDSLQIFRSVVKPKDINSAIPYLFRRIDEFSGNENFLYHTLKLNKKNKALEKLKDIFLKSLEKMKNLNNSPRFLEHKSTSSIYNHFNNEPDTNLLLPHSLKWQKEILEKWKNYPYQTISSDSETKNEKQINYASFNPKKPIYEFTLANIDQINLSIKTAKNFEFTWKNTSLEKRKELLLETAQLFRENRELLIGALMLDGGKTLKDSDEEVTRAIDAMEYYCVRTSKLEKIKTASFNPKGLIHISSAKTSPMCAAMINISAALITGNCVIFKPAPEVILISWIFINLFWKKIPKEALQFISCNNKNANTILLNPMIDTVVLHGKLKTLKEFLKINNSLDIFPSFKVKNAIIVSSAADRFLAIKNIIFSAFSYTGQKDCSASLAILEKEVYYDSNFRKNLIDATLNLEIGSNFNLKTDIPPLAYYNKELKEELLFLEKEEKWLLKPSQNSNNPLIWTPGIKIGVTPLNYSKSSTSIPVLSIMKAKNFDHAMKLLNSLSSNLSAGLQSLDEKEQRKFKKKAEASNLYINRPMVGQKIKRQPCGSHKRKGFKKGGPNYLMQFITPFQKFLPKEKKPVNDKVNSLTSFLEKFDLSAEELGTFYASIANYSYWWQIMKKFRDTTKIVGQDNFFGYLPHKSMTLRIYENDKYLDLLRVLAAALTCNLKLEVSFCKEKNKINWGELNYLFKIFDETEKDFHKRILNKEIKRIRLCEKASNELKQTASETLCIIEDTPVLADARYELLNYLKEISTSFDYHRSGSLGIREGELRKPLF
jgi:RHH-type proline utilization regulon transcriptional repressor/proline dehydrogenase/delta 1-pyrroline-5-carboxylate dehydrogenase